MAGKSKWLFGKKAKRSASAERRGNQQQVDIPFILPVGCLWFIGIPSYVTTLPLSSLRTWVIRSFFIAVFRIFPGIDHIWCRSGTKRPLQIALSVHRSVITVLIVPRSTCCTKKFICVRLNLVGVPPSPGQSSSTRTGEEGSSHHPGILKGQFANF